MINPFNLCCKLTYPTAFGDELSYYEELCKLVEFLNGTVISEFNKLETNVINFETNMTNKYNELMAVWAALQKWISEWFDNIDVDEEFYKLWQKVVASGEALEVMKPYIEQQLNIYWNQFLADYNTYKDNLTADYNTYKDNLTADNNKFKTDMQASFTTFTTNVNNTITQFESQLSNFNTQLTNFNTKLNQFGTRLDNYSVRLDNDEAAITANTTAIGNINTSIGQINSKITAMQTDISNLTTLVNQHTQQIESLNTQLSNIINFRVYNTISDMLSDSSIQPYNQCLVLRTYDATSHSYSVYTYAVYPWALKSTAKDNIYFLYTENDFKTGALTTSIHLSPIMLGTSATVNKYTITSLNNTVDNNFTSFKGVQNKAIDSLYNGLENEHNTLNIDFQQSNDTHVVYCSNWQISNIVLNVHGILTESVIINCHVNFMNYPSNIQWTNVKFINCTIAQNASAAPVFNNCKFVNCKITTLYSYINNSTVENCEFIGTGSAVASWDNTIFRDTSFNIATINFNTSPNNCAFYSCTFQNNTTLNKYADVTNLLVGCQIDEGWFAQFKYGSTFIDTQLILLDSLKVEDISTCYGTLKLISDFEDNVSMLIQNSNLNLNWIKSGNPLELQIQNSILNVNLTISSLLTLTRESSSSFVNLISSTKSYITDNTPTSVIVNNL